MSYHIISCYIGLYMFSTILHHYNHIIPPPDPAEGPASDVPRHSTLRPEPEAALPC